MSGRIDLVPEPPMATPPIRVWFQKVRDVLGLEAVRMPTLSGTWAAYGGTHGTPGYYKHGGIVHLTGTAKNGTAGTTIFTLPSGFRPGATVRFAGALIEVDASGNVTPDAAAGNTKVALDGVVFRAL